MRDCTFTPDIEKPMVAEPRGPVVVRGLGRYLEVKEMAKRKAKEKQ